MFDKKFEIGLSNIRIEEFDKRQEFIDSYFIGISPLDECRSNYIMVHRLREMIEKANKQNCKIWVCFNNLLIPNKQRQRKIDILMDLWTEYKFHGYIVADMIVARALLNYGVPVNISTVDDIRDMNDVNRLYRMGFKNVVLSYKVNRNYDFIKECCTTYPDMKFTLVVNELCESNCPYRMSHFLRVMAGESSKFECVVSDSFKNTIQWKLKVLKNCFIPPENLRILDELPNLIFKLATRTRDIDNLKTIDYIDMYRGVKKYDSILEFFHHQMNPMGIDEIKPSKDLIDAWLNCKNQCHKCRKCENHLNGLLDGKTE